MSPLSGGCASAPPRHGSSPARSVCGGAQRGISLAEVDFVGESTSNPLWEIQPDKPQYINGLHNHDLIVLDSFGKSTKSSLPNPLGQIHLAKSRPTNRLNAANTPVRDRHFSPGRTGSRPGLGCISVAVRLGRTERTGPRATASMTSFGYPMGWEWRGGCSWVWCFASKGIAHGQRPPRHSS